jgi:hypothetical protein
MAGRQCYHCKSWIEDGEAHDCWTTTEAALTRELPPDLQDAWERLRETAAAFGDQRIYASHHSIMFSRKSCYFFVRPKRAHLELCVFLNRPVNAPQVRRIDRASKTRMAHVIRVTHRDEVEAPITDWLREAYDLQELPATALPASSRARGAGSKERSGVNRTSRTGTPRPRARSGARPKTTRARSGADPKRGPAAGRPRKRPAAPTSKH